MSDVIVPEDGPTLPGNFEVVVKVRSADTHGVIEETIQPGDSAGFEAACRRHGIVFHRDSPWTAELRQRFDLR